MANSHSVFRFYSYFSTPLTSLVARSHCQAVREQEKQGEQTSLPAHKYLKKSDTISNTEAGAPQNIIPAQPDCGPGLLANNRSPIFGIIATLLRKHKTSGLSITVIVADHLDRRLMKGFSWGRGSRAMGY